MAATPSVMAPVPRPAHRFFSRTRTRAGKKSTRMVVWFVGVMAVFYLVEIPILSAARQPETKVIEWAWMAVMFATLGVAAAIAAAGLALALFAVFRRGERSAVMLVPILLGIFVVFFAIGEALGHDEPERGGSGYSPGLVPAAAVAEPPGPGPGVASAPRSP